MTEDELIKNDYSRKHLWEAIYRWRELYCRKAETPTWLAIVKSADGVDSPLEAAFLAWWIALDWHRKYSDVVQLRPQQTVIAGGELWRIDFVAVPDEARLRRASAANASIQKVAIEFDGYGFHERTPDQVQRRDRRDRALQVDGWHVLHFSFGEFDRDPEKCVEAVFTAAANEFKTL